MCQCIAARPAGVVAYLEHIPGVYRPTWDVRATEHSERQYIGIKTSWGPLLMAIVAGPLGQPSLIARLAWGISSVPSALEQGALWLAGGAAAAA